MAPTMIRLAFGAANIRPRADRLFVAAHWGLPIARCDIGAAGESLRIEQIFYAGQRAEIAAQASDSDTVALAISNPRAEAVCAKDLAPRANCNWLPIFTERFSIELKNHGSAPASVYIVFR